MDMSFVYFLLIGLCAGWLAGQLMKGGGFGIVGDLVIGVIGALVGGWLFGMLGLSVGGGLIGALITATVGAVVLLLLIRLVKRGGAV
jgi:uncharacterized membrane protein YeaQ/YmgE (transglycosylase-associated protein family)